MKLSRKVIISLSIMLIITNSPKVFAEGNNKNFSDKSNIEDSNMKYVSKEDAISKSKKILKDYFYLNLEDGQYELIADNLYVPHKDDIYGKSSRNLEWSSKEHSKFISVSIDALNNDILSVSVSNTSDSLIQKENMSSMEAQNMAKELLVKMAQDKAKFFKVERNNSEETYLVGKEIFNVVRVFDGVDVGFDGGTIEIDRVQKKPTFFYLNYTDNMEFEKKDSTIVSEEEARRIFYNNLKMDLIYIEDPININKFIPVYIPNFSNGYVLDAKNKKMMHNYEEQLRYNIKKEELDKMIGQYNEKQNKSINESNAKTLAVKICKDIMQKSLDVIKIEEYKNIRETECTKLWQVELGDNMNQKIYVTLDAKNGSIVGIYDASSETVKNNVLPKIEFKEAYNIALGKVVKYYPEKLPFIDTSQSIIDLAFDENTKMYNSYIYPFNFDRIENGVRVPSNSISVAVDGRNEKIISLGINWNNDAIFSEVKNSIDENKAKEIYMSNKKIKLEYGRDERTNKAKLLYVMKSIEYDKEVIHAINGNFVKSTKDW